MPIDPNLLQMLQPYLKGLNINANSGAISNVSNPYTDSSGNTGVDPNNPDLPVSGDPRRNAADILQKLRSSGITPSQSELSSLLALPNDQSITAGIANLGATNAAESQLQDLGKNISGQFADYFTNPNSQGYKTIAGNMNNSGLLNSGAFNSSLANSITGAILPEMYQTEAAPYQQNLSQNFGLNQMGADDAYNQYNLYQMQQYANGQKGGFDPSGILTGALGGAAAGSKFGPWGAVAGGAGGAGLGAATGGSGGHSNTWICTEMKRRGILTKQQVENLHDHLYRAFWKKPWSFIKYLVLGRFLVYLANRARMDWKLWKPNFYDNVIEEPDPVKAVALYEESFWILFDNVRKRLSFAGYHHGV